MVKYTLTTLLFCILFTTLSTSLPMSPTRGAYINQVEVNQSMYKSFHTLQQSFWDRFVDTLKAAFSNPHPPVYYPEFI